MEENHVYLMIEPLGSSQDVTDTLGLQPTKAWNAGDKKPPPSPAHYSSSKWLLESGAARDSSLEEHAAALLSVLEPIAEKVLSISSKSRACVFFASYCKDIHPGYIFSSAIVARIAALGLGMEFDIYPMSGKAVGANNSFQG